MQSFSIMKYKKFTSGYHCEWIFPTLFGCPGVEELLPKDEIFLLIMGNLESVRVTLVSNYVLFTYKESTRRNLLYLQKLKLLEVAMGFQSFWQLQNSYVNSPKSY